MPAVHVIYHFEDGAWWADSPDVERWSAAAPTIEELVRLVMEGVSFALESEVIDVEHSPAPDLMDVFHGRSVGGRLTLHVTNAFRDLLSDPPHVALATSGS